MEKIDFTSYQEFTRTTAVYTNIYYPQLGLAEETGELLGKMAKAYRDGVPDWDKYEESLKKEAGDVLWMLARLLDDQGISLEEVAKMNIDKLNNRKKNNTLHGEGDER